MLEDAKIKSVEGFLKAYEQNIISFNSYLDYVVKVKKNNLLFLKYACKKWKIRPNSSCHEGMPLTKESDKLKMLFPHDIIKSFKHSGTNPIFWTYISLWEYLGWIIIKFYLNVTYHCYINKNRNYIQIPNEIWYNTVINRYIISYRKLKNLI